MPHDAGHTSHHPHSHGHGHAHVHGAGSENRMGLAALLTGGFMLVEAAGGIIAGSLALLADAGHMLSDFASLALAWFAFRIARRPADTRRTYGFARVSVLAAFVNGLSLIAISIWIMVEAVLRMLQPGEVLAGAMLWIAIAGLGVNILAFAVLHGADRSSLNVRGALLHVLGDLLGSVAAIIAALVIMTTGWMIADPILSGLIALIILRSAWLLVSEAGHVLLEGAPGHIEVDHIARDLEQHIDGVEDVHHAHAWSLDGAAPLMTMHARIREPADAPTVIAAIKNRLRSVHHVDHATIEVETGNCAGTGGCD